MAPDDVLGTGEVTPRTPISLQEVFGHIDGLMALEGFDKTPAMAALDEAVIAGRATLREAVDFVLLNSKIAGAEDVLKSIGERDPRYAVIQARCIVQKRQLRERAIRMGGAMRLASGL